MLDFDFGDQGLPKVARDSWNKYRRIHKILLDNPEIIDMAHEDLKKLSDGEEGRVGDFTTEAILRTLIIYFAERKLLREIVVFVWESEFLQCFTKNLEGKAIDYAFLDRCLNALSRKTVEAIHQAIGLRGKGKRSKKIPWAHGEGGEGAENMHVKNEMVSLNERVFGIFDHRIE